MNNEQFSSPYPGYYLSIKQMILKCRKRHCFRPLLGVLLIYRLQMIYLFLTDSFRPLIRGVTYLCNRGQGKEKRELKFSSPSPGCYLSMIISDGFEVLFNVFVPFSGVLLIYRRVHCWNARSDCFRPLLRGVTYLCFEYNLNKCRYLLVFVPFSGVLLIYPIYYWRRRNNFCFRPLLRGVTYL